MKNTLVTCPPKARPRHLVGPPWRIGLVGLVLGFILGGAGAFADVRLPLNCAGDYNVSTPAWTMDFDLGVEFSEISHVYIDWSGEIYGSLKQNMDVSEPTPGNGSLDAYLGTPWPELSFAMASARGGESTYPDPEPFDMRSEFYLGYGSNWNDLLDGKEHITIYYPYFYTVPEVYILDYGSAVLSGATLVVDGSIIPEPATIVLLGFGFTQVLRRKNCNNRK